MLNALNRNSRGLAIGRLQVNMSRRRTISCLSARRDNVVFNSREANANRAAEECGRSNVSLGVWRQRMLFNKSTRAVHLAGVSINRRRDETLNSTPRVY